MNNKKITAAIIIIGDEILSGRTIDQNINFTACELIELGIILKEVRVIGDNEKEIITTVNDLRQKYDYIFTSGGIGPTHDDITANSIAKAFNQKLELNLQAQEILFKHYGKENVNAARLKMAYLPKNAKLLNNPISSAPGFNIENVFVMAGIPKIYKAMFESCKSLLNNGEKIFSHEIIINLTESIIALDLTKIQDQYPNISIGSYPFDGGTSLVFRSIDLQKINEAIKKMIDKIYTINPQAIINFK